MPKLANFDFIRFIPRDSDFLDRRVGSRGEIALGSDGFLRLYAGGDEQGGDQLVLNDLSNVSNSVFAAKVAAAGISGGGASVDVAETAPSSPESGNLWLNTTNGILYIYIDDGDTSQWMQPDVPKPNSITDLGITDGSDGQFLKTDGNGTFSFDTIDLTGYATTASIANSTNWDTAYGWGDHSAAGYLTAVAANSITPTELNITGNGTAGQVLTSDGDGSFSWAAAGAASTGAVTFTGTIIDTDDSSAIGFVPAVVMGSDLTVENDLVVRNNITTGNITISGDIETQGSGTPELASDNEILLTATTRVTLTSSPIKMASFTTTERNALTPANGDIIYNTTDNKFQGYENGAWVNLI
jgi:hypothetical protein